MHGLTGGGWKRKRYRPRSKRKLPGGNPRQERPDLQPNQSPPRQPPTLRAPSDQEVIVQVMTWSEARRRLPV